MIYQKRGTDIFVKFGADESSPAGYYTLECIPDKLPCYWPWRGTSPVMEVVENSLDWIKIDPETGMSA